MAFSFQDLKYGWVALASLGALGVTIYVAENTRSQIEPQDVAEIVLGTHERCIVAEVGPLSYVTNWVQSNESVTVTNAIGWHPDKAMMEALDAKIDEALPSFVLAPPGGSNNVAMKSAITGAWPWQVTMTGFYGRASVLYGMSNTVADCTSTQSARWHGGGTGLTVAAAEGDALGNLASDTSITNELSGWVMVDAYSNRTFTSGWYEVFEILPGQDYSSESPEWNTYKTNLLAEDGPSGVNGEYEWSDVTLDYQRLAGGAQIEEWGSGWLLGYAGCLWLNTNGAPIGLYELYDGSCTGTVTVSYLYWNHTWGAVEYPILTTNTFTYLDGTNEVTTNVFYTAEVMYNQHVFTTAAVATNFEHRAVIYLHGKKPSMATSNDFQGCPGGYAIMNEDEWWVYVNDDLKSLCASAWSTNAIASTPALPPDAGAVSASGHSVPWETSYAIGWEADDAACVMEWRGFEYCTNAIE